MKLTKRMKSAIIQSSIANVIFLILLIGAIAFFIVPRIKNITSLKTNLGEIYTEYNTIENAGLGYADLKAAALQYGLGQDLYIANLLRNVNEEFYKQNFTNTEAKNFISFLKDIESKILDTKLSSDYIKKDQTLDSILPIYTQDSTFSDVGLTDFYFVNYIENLIYTFNLSAQGEIGIGAIEKIGASHAVTTPDESEGENGLQEDIFQIPMRFKIEGQKSDVVDFIHFFENVGSIELQDKKMEIYSDRFISKVIQGDKSSTSYNIYKHQIADIVSLEWKDYPDSSTHSNGETLLSLMKGSQAREKVSVELDLNFYVSGVPGYRMEKYVQELLEDFDTLAQDLDLQSKKYTLQAYKFTKGEELQAISQLQNLSSIFTTEQENIQKLRVSLLKRENIQDTYELAIKYRSVLDWIEENYKKQIDILTVNAK